MRKLLSTLFVVFSLTVAHADILANGNFSDGVAHWRGDAHAISDTENKGIVIQLNPTKWTKISQTFNTRESGLNYTITYTTSTDYAPSTEPGMSGEQLTVDELIELTETRFQNPVKLPRGSWIVMVVDPSASQMTPRFIKPTLQSTSVQTARGSFPWLVAHEEKTVYLAFPPGKGSVTLLSISLDPRVQSAPLLQ